MEDRHVQILLEDINKKFDIIQEGYASLLEMKGDVAILKDDVHQLKEDMIIVKQSLQRKADVERVEKIEADVKVLQQKIA